MSRYTTLARRGVTVALSLALGLGLAACGHSDEQAEPRDTTTTAGTVPSINKAGLEPSGDVPEGSDSGLTRTPVQEPTANVINVDGGFDTLTPSALEGFERARPGVTVTEAFSGETRSFQRLCVGEVDIVDSARPITAEEYEQCRINGLDVVQFQVAADAIVIAIKAQTDVGTDCLSTDQLRAGFRAGSEINNWSQLGPNLDDVPFEAGGPTVDENAARFFGRYILENPEPVNSDFRVDYRATDDEQQTRSFVTGFESDSNKIRILPTIEPSYLQLRARLKEYWGYWADTNAEVIESVKEQRKGIRTKRSVAARAADDARVARAYRERSKIVVQINAIKAELAPLERPFAIADRSRRRLEGLQGHVGLFSHGYYATYENLLRPFEIEIEDGDGELNCIFPSPQTILNGEYPLSRQLLITVTTRSLQRPEVREFVDYYLANSQRVAEETGVVPLPNKDINRQRAWLEGDLPRFGFVDGRFVELQGSDEVVVVEPVAPPVENPAR